MTIYRSQNIRVSAFGSVTGFPSLMDPPRERSPWWVLPSPMGTTVLQSGCTWRGSSKIPSWEVVRRSWQHKSAVIQHRTTVRGVRGEGPISARQSPSSADKGHSTRPFSASIPICRVRCLSCPPAMVLAFWDFGWQEAEDSRVRSRISWI